jgi:hypothetical protein
LSAGQAAAFSAARASLGQSFQNRQRTHRASRTIIRGSDRMTTNPEVSLNYCHHWFTHRAGAFVEVQTKAGGLSISLSRWSSLPLPQ